MELNIDFLRSYDRDSIAAELRRISEVTGKKTVTVRDIQRHGRVSPKTVTLRFGSMGKAHEAAGLVRSPVRHWTTAELIQVIINLWKLTLAELGRSPRIPDVRRYGLPLSAAVIVKRFGSWKNALVTASQASDLVISDQPERPERTARRRRSIPPGTRFRILKRDLYTCCLCRKSGVEVEIDHVIPLSLGGSDSEDNLQTLCVPCNRGKAGELQ